MKRAIGIICFIALLFVAVTAIADQSEGVVVSNYQEMLDAVNEQKADLILISPKYKYKKEKSRLNYASYLNAEGRTITIRPEKEGEKATIDGYINIRGKGTVIIENTDIIAPTGYVALDVIDGAHVTAGKVTGGKGKSNNGCTTAYVCDASLTIDSAIGSDGKNGMGGDGIFIFGHSTVEIREAVGGNAEKGIGGAGIVIAGESEVTITGSATGGNGLYSAGKGVLAGWGSKCSGEGVVKEGNLLEGKKTLDPEIISNYLMLINAIRNGETEIHLDPKFKCGSGGNYIIDLIALSDQTVRIIGNPDSKQRPVLDCGLAAYSGSWTFDGVDIKQTGKEHRYCVTSYAGANITLTGNCSGTGGGIAQAPGGTIEITGNAQIGTERTAAVAATDSGSIRLTGDLSLTKDNNAVYVTDEGKIEIIGNINGKVNKNRPLIGVCGGKLSVTGNVSLAGEGVAVSVKGGEAEINGDVSGRNNKKICLIYSERGELAITGSISTSGVLIKNAGGKILIKGSADAGKDSGYYPIWLTSNGSEVTIEGNLTVDNSSAHVEHGTLTVGKSIIYTGKREREAEKTNGGGQIRVLHNE